MKVLNFIVISLFSYSLFAQSLPDYPSRNMDTIVIQKNGSGVYTPTSNHLPIIDMTRDGRIGLQRSGGKRFQSPPPLRNIGGGAPVYLMKPEKVNRHIKFPGNPIMGGGLTENKEEFRFRANQAVSQLNRNKIKAKIGRNLQNLDPARTILCEKFEKKSEPLCL